MAINLNRDKFETETSNNINEKDVPNSLSELCFITSIIIRITWNVFAL